MLVSQPYVYTHSTKKEHCIRQIGYKFAVLSMKAVMFVLLRHLQFDLPENPPKIERHEAHEV